MVPFATPTIGSALSLCVAIFAACMALGWTELDLRGSLAMRWRRLLGIGMSLGTGTWAVHAFAVGPLGADLQVVGELAFWVAATAIGTAALGWPEARKARLMHRLMGACGLASSIVALQALGALSGERQPSPLTWHVAPLGAAWLVALVASLAAVGLSHATRHASSARVLAARIGAGVLIGTALLASQLLIGGAASLAEPAHPIPLDTLSIVAALFSISLLALSRRELQQLRRVAAADAEERRKRSALSPNDPLTGLPARARFEGALTQATQQADATSQRLALLVVNLDGFKIINQNFGTEGGDQVLRDVARRLRGLAKPHLAARLDNDEFLMLLDGDPTTNNASALAVSVIDAIAKPFKVGNRAASLGCSIGVAMYPEHGARSTMIGHAHVAMTAAKSAGGSSHAFYDPRMVQGMREDAELLRDLRSALEQRRLELYYQPKIHAPSGQITGAEALLRWHHPQRGMVSPAVFIPIAERHGLINAIGRWVIEEACRQAGAWRDQGLRMRVAINLSVHQLRQADLATWIVDALQRHQINPDLITCEITESTAMDDTEVTMRVLSALDEVGVHISIDDFGTGHSSLSYLRKLPADELKIDRSFVSDLETSEDARKVAVAVINLAKALKLNVVAEGVETEEQDRILREFGCDQLQGFLFAKPMSAKALALWAMDDVGPRTMTFRDSLFEATAPAPL